MKFNLQYIAKLANLPLKKDEEEKLSDQLNSTLDYIKMLSEVDTQDISPTSQVTDQTNVLREDKALPSFSQEDALANSKHTYNGFFKVKAILKNE